MSDIKFAEGLYFKKPHEKAPDFVNGSISIHKEKFACWLDEQEANDKGYINLVIKTSQSGKPYVAVDTWEPKQAQQQPQQEPQQAQAQDMLDGVGGPSAVDDCPF